MQHPGSLSRRDGVCVTQSAFGKAFVYDRQQCDRRERLAQASHRAELESHSQEVRSRRVEVRKGVSRHRNQRNSRHTFVEYPDRLEAAHVRHENVDNRQVDDGVLERAKSSFAAIGYRHSETVIEGTLSPVELPPSVEEKMPAISRPPSRLLQVLPTAEFLSLHPRLETVELANEAVLVEAGAPVQQVYLPHSGAVAMMVSPSQGQAVEVAMVGRDSVVGVSAALDRGVSLTNAIVVAPGTASVLKAEDVRVAAGRSSTLRNLVARHQQALSAHARQSAACNASHSVEARLSRLLLRARFVRQRTIAADPGIPGANDRRAA